MRSTMQDFQLTIGSILRARHAGARRLRGGHRDRRRLPLARRTRDVGGAGRPARQRAALARHHRRPAGRHLPVEQRRAPRGLPRRPVDGRGAAHAEHPALPRAARLHRQPRRGQGRHRRRLAGAAARQAARQARDRRARARRRPDAAAADLDSLRATGKQVHAVRRPAGRRSPTSSTGPTSTSATPRRCATPAARPATRRASSTATARRTCTRRRCAPAPSAGLDVHDRVLPIVPMFHANAWGLAYAALMSGASLCMPDRWLQAEPLVRFMQETRPTLSGAVPTVWNDVLNYLDSHDDITPRLDPADPLRRLRGAGRAAEGARGAARHRDPAGLGHDRDLAGRDGGAASRSASRATTSGTTAAARAGCSAASRAASAATTARCCRATARRSASSRCAAPWVTGGYYKDDDPEKSSTTAGCAPATSASSTPLGYIQLTDRAKDVIKSGGEWISSVDLENALMAHPDVRRGRGRRHPRREVGRAPARLRRAAGGRDGHARRAARVPAEARQVAAPGRLGVHRGGARGPRSASSTRRSSASGTPTASSTSSRGGSRGPAQWRADSERRQRSGDHDGLPVRSSSASASVIARSPALIPSQRSGSGSQRRLTWSTQGSVTRSVSAR